MGKPQGAAASTRRREDCCCSFWRRLCCCCCCCGEEDRPVKVSNSTQTAPLPTPKQLPEPPPDPRPPPTPPPKKPFRVKLVFSDKGDEVLKQAARSKKHKHQPSTVRGAIKPCVLIIDPRDDITKLRAKAQQLLNEVLQAEGEQPLDITTLIRTHAGKEGRAGASVDSSVCLYSTDSAHFCDVPSATPAYMCIGEGGTIQALVADPLCYHVMAEVTLQDNGRRVVYSVRVLHSQMSDRKNARVEAVVLAAIDIFAREYGTEVVEALGPVESCAALLVDPDDGSRAFLDRKEAIEAALKPGDIMMLEPSGHRWALPTPYKDITAPLSTTASLRYRASRSGAGTAAKTSYDGRGGASGHDSRRSSRNGGDQQLPQAQQPQRGVYYDSASESVRRVRRSDKGKHKRGAGAGASAPVLPEDEYP